MSTRILMINSRRFLSSIILSLWLVSCMNSRSILAPIRGVHNNRVENQRIKYNSHIFYNRTYESIPRGRYSNKKYTVKHGDTLFYISWMCGNSLLKLAERNHISKPYILNIGQRIQCDPYSFNRDGYMLEETDAAQGNIVYIPFRDQMQTKIINDPLLKLNNNDLEIKKALSVKSEERISHIIPSVAYPNIINKTSISNWRWPTNGKIIDNFSLSEGGNKGVDISGPSGHPIFAAADGQVVYAGNALRGYGNLVIIKHNDDYLSAYAHNEKLLVREQQKVKSGQKVATMGSTGATSVRLHFEIRYKGKSVNPLHYLPPRSHE